MAGAGYGWLVAVVAVLLVASTVRWNGCCDVFEEASGANGARVIPMQGAAGDLRHRTWGWPGPTAAAAALSSVIAGSWIMDSWIAREVKALTLSCVYGGRAQSLLDPVDDALVTPLIPEGAPISRIAFGSCNKPPEPGHHGQDELWRSVVAFQPELWIWLGDNVYADKKQWVDAQAGGAPSAAGPPSSLRAWVALKAMALFDSEDGFLPQVYGMILLKLLGHSDRSPLVKKVWEHPGPQGLRELYHSQMSVPGYVKMLGRGVGVAGTWDDHDYGINDAGKEFADKEVSRSLALEFLQEPPGSGRWKREGIYASYVFGEKGKRLRLILLDTRWARDAIDSDGTMLGEEQWQWLEGLFVGADSGAEVTLIGSSVQFVGGVDVMMRPHIRTEGCVPSREINTCTPE